MNTTQAEHGVPGAITRRLAVWAVIVAAILMIPFIGNAPWTAGDYIFSGTVLFGAATVYEMATRNMRGSSRRYIIAAVIVAVLIMIWGWAVA